MPGSSFRQGHGYLVRWSGKLAVVALPGQIGLSSAGPVAEQLLSVLDGGATVLVADMTATHSCDQAGTAALARVHRHAVANGAELRLVVPAPGMRRVIRLSGLARLVPVLPTLEAAMVAPSSAVVLSLPIPAPRAGSAPPAAPDGPYPVASRPARSSARLNRFGPAAQPGMRRHEFEDELARITHGIFHAGLALQADLDQPADTLRRSAERVLDLLARIVDEARTAGFAEHGRAADGRADDPAEDRVMARPGAQARPGPLRGGRGDTPGRAESILAAARQSRARSRAMQARSHEVAVASATIENRVAATLDQLAVACPQRSAQLRTLSQAAAGHAARMRQWAGDHAATG